MATTTKFITAINLLPLLVLADQSLLSLKSNLNLSPFSALNKINLDLTSRTDSTHSPMCSPGFFPGTDTVLYSTPYTYSHVYSLIGDFASLPYAAGPPQNIRLNGSDNAVGTARIYTSPALPGAQITETLTQYSAPAGGPFHEVLAFDPFTVTTSSPDTGKETNVTLYGDYDAVTATPICQGMATQLNYTINFCATDPMLAAEVSHRGHLAMAEGTNRLLGNKSFTSCPQLQAEGGNGTLGYPAWGGGLFMGVGNSPQGEGAWWSVCLGVILFCSYLIVLGGGVFNY